MQSVRLSLLRGVCQTPAYVAADCGFFRAEGIDARIELAPTAWVVPERLAKGELDFAVLPWTRVALSGPRGEDLVVLCGSGCEEAAVVVRTGLELTDVKRVAVPQEGGMKDLTAAALLRSMGRGPADTVRMPSGDGAILAFIGGAAEAAVMVEPWASMLESVGLGRVVLRTGDVLPGAPGCSLAASRRTLETRPALVRSVVSAYVAAWEHLDGHEDECAEVAASYVGVSAEIMRRALGANRPDVHALHQVEAMDRVLGLMQELGYADEKPEGFVELGFLDEILERRRSRR